MPPPASGLTSAPYHLGSSFSRPAPKGVPSFLALQGAMASSDSSVETDPLAHTSGPTPGPHLEAPEPKVTISVLEISSPSPLCWSSLPPPKTASHHVSGSLATQKLQDILQDLKDVLKSVADLGGVTEAKDTSEGSTISKDGSEHREPTRGPDQADKVVSKNLLLCLDLEERQRLTSDSQSPKNTGHLSASTWEKHSEGHRGLPKAQLSKEEASSRHREENAKLRDNMEQLLQEAEHWSQQHMELSKLLRSYQQSQRDQGVAEDGQRAQLQSQPLSHVCAGQALEAAVRRLNQDTHSLHVVAALLESQCQILQQRMQILRASCLSPEAPSPEMPPQRNQQGKNVQGPPKAGRVESSLPCLGGAFPKKDRIFRSSDPCLNKKAHSNQFNTRIARALMGRKRPTCSFS
ncbi:spermatogenic leucine zipper protein 1 [Octodon degus]|uniref:Spermatogenic leucine zipper protein 1 n=1 Tax=Octodon degus TaxID=10160 RepID=A0A6P3F8B5_OCTDE|nr:spermatogenic leucine zipper protein 1 [Octodon degus]